MADEPRDGDVNHRSDDSPCKIKPAGNSIEGVDDFISSLPDEILQHVLSFISTEFAIRTSILSKRWRHVWSKTPSLRFDCVRPTTISKTLTYYKAPKITSFHIWASKLPNASQIDSWMEFAVSHKAEKLSFTLRYDGAKNYCIPDSFYVNSSLKQLDLRIYYLEMIPRCSEVVWKSLKNLSLTRCRFGSESFPMILSGCPVLERLELNTCHLPERFDLSKSLCLRRLVIDGCYWFQGLLQIVAPHIHSLRLGKYRSPCSLLDVSSLTEANLDKFSSLAKPLTKNFQDMLKMLEKLHNVNKLTVGAVYLQRLLQNSHGLKKLTLAQKDYRSISEKDFDSYLNSQGMNPDQLKDQTFTMFLGNKPSPEVVALFVELVLKNTKLVETIIVREEDDLDEIRFEELLQMASTLSQGNNVSIMIVK